jgi:hypothetical protein
MSWAKQAHQAMRVCEKLQDDLKIYLAGIYGTRQ